MVDVIVTGDLLVRGDITGASSLNVPQFSRIGPTSVVGAVNIIHNLTVGGDTDVAGTASVDSNLGTAGDITLENVATIQGTTVPSDIQFYLYAIHAAISTPSWNISSPEFEPFVMGVYANGPFTNWSDSDDFTIFGIDFATGITLKKRGWYDVTISGIVGTSSPNRVFLSKHASNGAEYTQSCRTEGGDAQSQLTLSFRIESDGTEVIAPYMSSSIATTVKVYTLRNEIRYISRSTV